MEQSQKPSEKENPHYEIVIVRSALRVFKKSVSLISVKFESGLKN